jgi:DNA-binding transcriptional MocR family regulator
MGKIDFLNNLASKTFKYDLGAGVPPLHLYPEIDINELLNIFSKSSSVDKFQYHSTSGIISEIVEDYFTFAEKITIPKSQLFVTNGVQEAIAIVNQIFKNSSAMYIDPYYPGFTENAIMTGLQITSMDASSMIESLTFTPKGSIVYLIPDFSNPSGYSLTLSEREEVLRIAEERDFYIFEDATYRPFYLKDQLPTMLSLNKERVVHAFSFSKIFAPSIRIAFVSVPDSLKNKFSEVKSNLSINTSGISQSIVAGWLIKNSFNFDLHLKTIRELLKINHEIVDNFSIPLEKTGGFFRFLELPNQNCNFEYCEKLMTDFDIAICPMFLFSNDTKNQNKLRISLANISPLNLTEALKIIKNE